MGLVCGLYRITLRHDDDPQWLYTPTAPAQVGSIVGKHRHGRFLLLQIVDLDIRPTPA
jgi:hypothetical protein